jgi:LuxR family maltose regulon positive regulatory protein
MKEFAPRGTPGQSNCKGCGGSKNKLLAELRVLRLLPTHLSLEEIAGTLSISRNTVKSQVAAVYRKLGADRRADAVRAATRLGLVT